MGKRPPENPEGAKPAGSACTVRAVGSPVLQVRGLRLRLLPQALLDKGTDQGTDGCVLLKCFDLEFIPVLYWYSDSDSCLLWISGLPGHRNSYLHRGPGPTAMVIDTPAWEQ